MVETGKPVDGMIEFYRADGSRAKHPVIAGRISDDSIDPEVKAAVDAVIDYNLAEVRKKMELHGVDFDMALEMQKAVILASAASIDEALR